MLEAYRIGIKLSLINNITSGMKVISGNFADAHKDAVKFEEQLKRIKLLGATGMAIGGAGFFGLNLFSKTLKPAEEYAHQLAQMNVAGMKHLEIVKATQAAWDATKLVPTSNVSENLASIRELRMVFRGVTDEAIKYMPVIQKLQGSLGTVRHGEGQAKNEAYGIAKALEMKGAVKDPSLFTQEADMMARAIIASGGKISGSDFQRTFALGRSATSGWSNRFAYEILPTLMQEMKGGASGQAANPGTALMSTYAAIVGGTVSQKALKLWQQLGLVDMSKAVFTKDGHLKGIAPGGIKGWQTMIENPDLFARNVVQPALLAHGYKTEQQQKMTYQYLFPNRTAGFAMTQFGMQPWKFEGDQKLIQNTPSAYKSYDDMLKNDPVMKRLALEKQWETMLTRLGFDVMPQLLTVMEKSLKIIQNVTEWTGKHEKVTKALVWAFVGLSGAMAISGTVMTLTAGFKGMNLVCDLLGASGGMLPKVISLLGKGGLQGALVLAAGGIGYFMGTLINDKIINAAVKKMTGEKEDSLGALWYDTTHGTGPMAEAPDPRLTRGSILNSVKPGVRGQTVQVHSVIQLDKREVGKAVTEHQVSGMERAILSVGPFDNSLSLAPVGF